MAAGEGKVNRGRWEDSRRSGELVERSECLPRKLLRVRLQIRWCAHSRPCAGRGRWMHGVAVRGGYSGARKGVRKARRGD